MALGLDSLAAVDLVKSLERQTRCTLPLTLFFEYTTIRELAAYLQTHVPTLSASGAALLDTPPETLAADDEGGPFPLTPVQQAFFVESRALSGYRGVFISAPDDSWTTIGITAAGSVVGAGGAPPYVARAVRAAFAGQYGPAAHPSGRRIDGGLAVVA